MAYLNGKKIMFSPHVHGVAVESVTVTIEIAQAAQGAGRYLGIYGTAYDGNDTEIEIYRNDRMSNSVTVTLARDTFLTICIYGGLETNQAPEYIAPMDENASYSLFKIDDQIPDNGTIQYIAS